MGTEDAGRKVSVQVLVWIAAKVVHTGHNEASGFQLQFLSRAGAAFICNMVSRAITASLSISPTIM